MGKDRMNVFTDLHHGDLYYSLVLLFEKHLGMKLYRPIGLDWFKKGYWKIAEPYGNAPDTIAQYLQPPSVDKPAQKYDVNKYGETQLIDDVYCIPCKVSDEYYIQNAITFDKFLKIDFDYIISTYMGHDGPYFNLVKKYKPNAKYIKQLGNVGIVPRFAKNVLAAIYTPLPRDVNYIIYHPEHHRDYCYTPPTNHDVIKSFMNCLNNDHMQRLWWNVYKEVLPDVTWKMHGIVGDDGVISNDEMPKAIKDSAFVWHVKTAGCGGFVPRQAMACGRPVIIRSSLAHTHYALVKDIYVDGLNCIDLDEGDEWVNSDKLEYYMEPDNHRDLCESTVESFNERVNFAREAQKIKAWLYDLK